jgi:hypothetical protein
MLIHIQITPEILTEATEKAAKVPFLTEGRNSPEDKLIGALGELAAVRYLNAEPITDNVDYDMIYRGKTIDCKSLKTNVVPNFAHSGHVEARNTLQACDYYLFTRVLYRNGQPHTVYIMAYMRPAGFYQKAHFVRKGTRAAWGYLTHDDLYELEYRRMLDPQRMLRPDWPQVDSMQQLLTEARDTARTLVDPTPSETRDNAVNIVKSWN